MSPRNDLLNGNLGRMSLRGIVSNKQLKKIFPLGAFWDVKPTWEDCSRSDEDGPSGWALWGAGIIWRWIRSWHNTRRHSEPWPRSESHLRPRCETTELDAHVTVHPELRHKIEAKNKELWLYRTGECKWHGVCDENDHCRTQRFH